MFSRGRLPRGLLFVDATAACTSQNSSAHHFSPAEIQSRKRCKSPQGAFGVQSGDANAHNRSCKVRAQNLAPRGHTGRNVDKFRSGFGTLGDTCRNLCKANPCHTSTWMFANIHVYPLQSAII
jgi:hypothetical protein